jgi:hypothetical protein
VPYMMENVDSVGGELLGRDRGTVATFPPGRICEEPGCATRLSRYNSRSRCAAHDFDATLLHFRCPTPPASASAPHGQHRKRTAA